MTREQRRLLLGVLMVVSPEEVACGVRLEGKERAKLFRIRGGGARQSQ